TALYSKVVDSDDWVDQKSGKRLLDFARTQLKVPNPVDLIIANYVYEKVHEQSQTPMRYTNVFPQDKVFGWEDIGHFHVSQYLLMHSVMYRTQVLRDCNLELPKHTFYVDNIFVYAPLVQVKRMYYINCDFYRYFIGRQDQSVNEDIMYSRRDQQLRVTKIMIDAIDLNTVTPGKLKAYMKSYLAMMMSICSIFLRLHADDENEVARRDIWAYLKEHQPKLYGRIRYSLTNVATNIPTSWGRYIGLALYRIAQKMFHFN
ncbi:MAG: glycosyl transferase, partial [Eggerthellaceae bacterium]|nr:glycosyl transferase [Eggerthellaceae bacterium]